MDLVRRAPTSTSLDDLNVAEPGEARILAEPLWRHRRLRLHTRTRTIRREDVYERLEARTRPDESFSDLLERLTDRESDFEAGFGALTDVDFEGAVADLDDRFDGAFGR